MYYIFTADRLQRTAPWFEDLEGGIEGLRAVIFDDSLGICADLDAAMQTHIGSYEDEWKATLDDPEKLRRFASFVNAPTTPDPSLAYTAERGQAAARDRIRARRGRRAHRRNHPGGAPMTLVDETPRRHRAGGLGARVRAHRPRGRARARGAARRHPDRALPAHGGRVHAVSNFDPYSRANVISRGIVGTRQDAPTVASPMYKQVFDLRTGACLDTQGKEPIALQVWPVTVSDGDVLSWVRAANRGFGTSPKESVMTTMLGVSLAGRTVVMVGGGAVTARRLERFLAEGARVTIVAPELSDAVRTVVDAGEVDLDPASRCARTTSRMRGSCTRRRATAAWTPTSRRHASVAASCA